jgi:hypothetical protein
MELIRYNQINFFPPWPSLFGAISVCVLCSAMTVSCSLGRPKVLLLLPSILSLSVHTHTHSFEKNKSETDPLFHRSVNGCILHTTSVRGAARGGGWKQLTNSEQKGNISHRYFETEVRYVNLEIFN